MRVLQLSKFYPPVLGGIETVAWELTEGLARVGVECDVLCSNQCARTVVERAPSGYTVCRAASLGMALSTSMAPTMPMLLARMARGRDIVHLHMPDPMAALALWLARPSARVVVHWHSDVIRQRRTLFLYEPLQRWVLKRANAIIATSPPYAESSEPLRPWRGKVRIVPIGIGDNRSQVRTGQVDAIRARFGDRRIVFALGRMTHYKGFDVLIDAAASLPAECVVVVGGEGERLTKHRFSVNTRQLADKVHFIGHVDEAELPNWLQACDIFCMPSTMRAEAYGVAMLEAMVMGKPSVASDITGSGVPWVNVEEESGLNVLPGDAEALGAALRRLLADDALRARLGKGARQRYLSHFTASTMTRRTVEVYASLESTGTRKDFST